MLECPITALRRSSSSAVRASLSPQMLLPADTHSSRLPECRQEAPLQVSLSARFISQRKLSLKALRALHAQVLSVNSGKRGPIWQRQSRNCRGR